MKSGLLVLSALAVLIASTPASSESAFFRITPQMATAAGSPPSPEGEANAPIDIIMDGGIWRAPANIDIPAIVTGADGSFSVTDNSLDLSWSSSGADGAGRVSGTIVTSTHLELTATDADGSVTKGVDLVVNPALSIAADPQQLGPYRPGDLISISPQVYGRLGSIDLSVLNAGDHPLIANDETGIISGIAGAPGILSDFEILVQDSSDEATATTGPLSLVIEAAPLAVDISDLVVRRPASVAMPVAASGGYGARIVSGVGLPAGLTVSGSSIVGAPVAGTYAVTVGVADAFGTTPAQDTATLTVHPALSASVTSATTVFVGGSVDLTPTATGLVGAASWQLAATSTALPQGLSLAPVTGRITGTLATASQTAGLRLEVKDSFDGATVPSNTFSIAAVADTTPDAFSLAAVSDAVPGTVYQSDEIVPTGYTDAVMVTATGSGQVSVEGGSFTSSVAISPGQSFRVRLTAAAYQGSVSTNVKVGNGAAVTWTVTSQGEYVVNISSGTNVVLSDVFGAEWNSARPKRAIIDAGVIIGSTTTSEAALRTGTGGAGTIRLTINGQIQGAPGAANSGVGGDAFLIERAVTVTNNGSILAGGGGGGRGATGTAGVIGTTVTDGPSFAQNGTEWRETAGTRSVTWQSQSKGSITTSATSFVGTDGATYTRGTSQRIQSGSEYFSVSRTGVVNSPAAGGTGGNGGIGQGFGNSNVAGSLGGPSAGGTALPGFTGGDGGLWGQPGSQGTNGGSAGGLAGYGVRSLSAYSLSGSGIVRGR